MLHYFYLTSYNSRFVFAQKLIWWQKTVTSLKDNKLRYFWDVSCRNSIFNFKRNIIAKSNALDTLSVLSSWNVISCISCVRNKHKTIYFPLQCIPWDTDRFCFSRIVNLEWSTHLSISKIFVRQTLLKYFLQYHVTSLLLWMFYYTKSLVD